MFEKFRDLLKPLVEFLAKPLTIFHPNVISIMSIAVAFPGFYFLANGDSLVGALFILGGLFDAFDGAVARMTGKTSKFGGILDSTIDRFFEGLLFMFIAIGGLAPVWLLFLIFNISICISFIKAKAETIVGTDSVGKNQFSVGVAQRGDRLAVVFFGLIFNGLFTEENNEILLAAMVLLLVLTSITLLWRAWVIWKVVD